MFSKLLLVSICGLIFGYYAFKSVAGYLSYKTISQHSRERQERQPLPQICLSSDQTHQRLDQLGMSHKEYEYEGIWTSSDGNYSTLSENQVKRIISPDLNDLLLKIKVRSRINDDSDRYEEEVFTSEEILNGTKVKILELDSVEYFAIFCFHFSQASFPFGIEKVYLHVNSYQYQYHISIFNHIEKVYLHVKEKSKVFVVSPGNFYTFERKRNQMSVIPELKYDYQVFCFFTQSNLI